jgi:hypothetical protein
MIGAVKIVSYICSVKKKKILYLSYRPKVEIGITLLYIYCQ